MTPDFSFKLGQLIGSLQDFLLRVELGQENQGDIDRIKTLTKDVQKKFYNQTLEEDNEEDLFD